MVAEDTAEVAKVKEEAEAATVEGYRSENRGNESRVSRQNGVNGDRFYGSEGRGRPWSIMEITQQKKGETQGSDRTAVAGRVESCQAGVEQVSVADTSLQK